MTTMFTSCQYLIDIEVNSENTRCKR